MGLFLNLLIYLCENFMSPVVIQSEYAAHNREWPGSWREVGRPTVLNIICSEDENDQKKQQTFDIPIHKGSKHRKDWIHYEGRDFV